MWWALRKDNFEWNCHALYGQVDVTLRLRHMLCFNINCASSRHRFRMLGIFPFCRGISFRLVSRQWGFLARICMARMVCISPSRKMNTYTTCYRTRRRRCRHTLATASIVLRLISWETNVEGTFMAASQDEHLGISSASALWSVATRLSGGYTIRSLEI